MGRETMRALILIVALGTLVGCAQDMHKVLSAATHACGILHVEGYFTDTQGDVKLVKVPEGEDPNVFCPE